MNWVRFEVKLYPLLDQGHISMIFNLCSDIIGLKGVWHSRANLMKTWSLENCDSIFLSEQKPLRSRWSRFWKVTFRRPETKWQHNKDATQKKGNCMFGGQQEVRYHELSPYSITQREMLTPSISCPQLNKLLMVRPQHTSHRGCGWSQGDVAFTRVKDEACLT